MNIKVNINLANSFTILLSLLFLSCSKEPTTSTIDFNVNPQIKDNKIELLLNFTSNDNQKILLNWDALSINDPHFENDKLNLENIELNKLIDSLSSTQFIVENKSNERRFFSNIKLFEGETIDVKTTFAVEPNIDTIKLASNKKVVLKSLPININRFKNNQSDTIIRLHYLFKPTKEQKENGYASLVLTSNWFKLPN